jgi:hypothetical protein
VESKHQATSPPGKRGTAKATQIPVLQLKQF